MCVLQWRKGHVMTDVVRLRVLINGDDGMPRVTVHAAEWRLWHATPDVI